MTVTLSQVQRAARAHRAPLAGESAGYLVLALADQVLSAPRLIQPADIQLTEDGGLRVLGGQASSEADAELSLRRALDGLLLVASSGSAALMRASRRASPVGLSALVRELEAALIPVNRAAARRALARLHRETARALASGVLPDETAEGEEPAVLAEPVAMVPVPVVAVAVASELLERDPQPELEKDGIEIDAEDELETRAIEVKAPEGVDSPLALANLDGVPSALSDDSGAPPDTAQSGDALTVALEVRPVSLTVEAVAPCVVALDHAVALDDGAFALDEDVEFIDEEPSDALTVARNIEVMPIALCLSSEDACVELPEEVCTRPEPIILRQALRPLAQPELPSPVAELSSRTPTLGSLAAELPVLRPEQIAELSTAQAAAVADAAAAITPSVSEPEGAELVLCSAGPEECTEPMPEVAPLVYGVAIVASRKSDVSELLENFQVAQGDTNQGLCRAIKEMAGLDLTPAPFAALIR